MVAQKVKNLHATQKTLREKRPSSIPQSGRPLGEGNGYTLVFFPREFHGQRSLVGYSPWGNKESDMTERQHFHFFMGNIIGNQIKGIFSNSSSLLTY